MVIRQKITGLALALICACAPQERLVKRPILDVNRYGERLLIEVSGSNSTWNAEIDEALDEAFALAPRHRLERVLRGTPYDLRVVVAMDPPTLGEDRSERTQVLLKIYDAQAAALLEQTLNISFAAGANNHSLLADEVAMQLNRVYAPWFKNVVTDAQLLDCETPQCAETKKKFLAGHFRQSESLITTTLGKFSGFGVDVPRTQKARVALALCRRAMVREYLEHLDTAAIDYKRAALLGVTVPACTRMRERLRNYQGARRALLN